MINDKATRDSIESFTDAKTFPDIIRFIQDKDGDWMTSQECLTDPKYMKEPVIISELSRAITKVPNPKDVPPITGDVIAVTPKP